ncbi:MAG: hypothetical protein AAB650_01180 [Patescibacteria group bacterium]
MKNALIAGAAVVVIAALLFIWKAASDPEGGKLVGKTLLVSAFTSNGEATGKVLLQVPFVRALEASALINIAVDTNNDGSFSEDEYFVTDFPVRPRANWRNGFYVRSEVPMTNGMNARVAINGDEYEASVETKTVEVGELLDIASVTDPENATKGWGMPVAYAQEGAVEITQEGVPDLTQRTGECAPTAAADSIISLAAKNGGGGLLPGDPRDLVENLKRHMNWTPENGVPPDDFVAGKNRWAAATGVPIKTTKVGDAHGASTVDAIRDALQNGDAVDLRIKFGDASGKAVGGHMVTVTGIHQGGGQTYLDINDPATPDSGT